MSSANNFRVQAPPMAGGTVKIRRPGQPPGPGGGGGPTGGKLMRLRCRFRPLHDTYVVNGDICDRDSDVVFICADGRANAHKIILSSSSVFFSKIFEDQAGGSLTSVIVPDIPVATLKNLLMLAYRESLTLTKKQMREVADVLPNFGLNLKSFIYDDNIGSTNAEVQKLHQQQQQIQKPRPPPLMRPIPQQQPGLPGGGQNILQRQLGQPPLKPMGSLNAGKGVINTLLGRAPGLKPRPGGRDGSEEDDEPAYKFKVQGYGDAASNLAQQLQRQKQMLAQGQRPASQGNPLQHQQLLKQGHPQQIQTQFKVRPTMITGTGSSQQQQNTNISPPIGNFRKIAPKPLARPPGLGTSSSQANNSGTTAGAATSGSTTMGDHEITFENTEDDESSIADPEQGRAMIQEWMKNVGRNNEKLRTPGSFPSPAKKQKADDLDGQEAGSSPEGGDGPIKNQCLICANVFENPEKWAWHETHHVGLGIFKCAYCDELFSTSRKVFQHEMMEHGITNSAAIETPSIPSDFEIVQGRKRKPHVPATGTGNNTEQEREKQYPSIPRMTLVRTANGTHYRRAPNSSNNLQKKIAAKYRKQQTGGYTRGSRHPGIGIGMSEGEELLGERKIKQLHWVYVCERCQVCSDSLGKAQVHHTKCYPDSDVPFEDTVTKYRQGFFGKCKCPICPRRYTTNHGFTIHCGHMHNEYRRKFNHSSGDDTLVCTTCRSKFNEPEEFNFHIGGNMDGEGECKAEVDFASSSGDKNVKWIGNEMPGQQASSHGHGTRMKSSPIKKEAAGSRSSTPVSASSAAGAAPLPTSSTLSRSTRLANRRTMTNEGEISEDNFSPVGCPVCGEEVKIVEHLKEKHPELDLEVSRVSESAFRCQKCLISFALCDLVAHNILCPRSKEFQHVKERQVAATGLLGKGGRLKGSPRAQTPLADTSSIVIPPGIGVSPIDEVEVKDLLAPEVMEAAMNCGVCGRVNKKFGIISECLRSHGVYRCALCFNSYLDRATYSAHLRSCHTAPSGRLQCPLCSRSQFVNAGQVAGHMYGTHWVSIIRDGGSKPNSAATAAAAAALRAAALRASAAASEEPHPEMNTSDTDGEKPEDTTTTTEDDSMEIDESISESVDDYSNITLGSLLQSSEKPDAAAQQELSAEDIVNGSGDGEVAEAEAGESELAESADTSEEIPQEAVQPEAEAASDAPAE